MAISYRTALGVTLHTTQCLCLLDVEVTNDQKHRRYNEDYQFKGFSFKQHNWFVNKSAKTANKIYVTKRFIGHST